MLPPIDLDPIILAARVAKRISINQRLAYAQLDADLTVVQTSPNFSALMRDSNLMSVHGEHISDLLWEFVGGNATLKAIIDGEIPNYRIEHIHRDG